MDYQTVLINASKTLKNNLIKNPKLDCEILLSNVLKIERERLLINLDKKISEKDLSVFNNLITRRKKKRTPRRNKTRTRKSKRYKIIPSKRTSNYQKRASKKTKKIS